MDLRHSLVHVLILAVAPMAAASNCCPNGTVYIMHVRGCAYPGEENPNLIQKFINCTWDMFILDPMKDPQDVFTVMEDGFLKIGEEEPFTVPPHMYCITSAQMERDVPNITRDIAFACFPGTEEKEPYNDTTWDRSLYYGILQSISTVFLFLTLVIYLLIPELRDLQGKCIMSTLLCQLLGYLFLAGIQFRGHSIEATTCVVAAFSLYFWMLAAFFWLNIVSFNVWRTVWLENRAFHFLIGLMHLLHWIPTARVRAHNPDATDFQRYNRFFLTDDQLFRCFCLYGWLTPIAFLVAALTTHHMPDTEYSILRPNFGLTRCWFHGDTESWVYFLAPISMMLACNVVLFVMTAVRLWKTNGCESTMPGLRSSRFKCILYLKLFLIMGIIWIFEVLSFLFKGYDGLWHITDTLNSLQGVFIFIIVACRKRVFTALSNREWGKNIVGRMCPRSCTSGPDLEQEEPMLRGRGEDETYVPMDAAGKEDT